MSGVSESVRLSGWTHSAISVEAANAGANDGASGSCSVAANHVDSARTGKVNRSGAEPRGHVGGCVGGGPAGSVSKLMLAASVCHEPSHRAFQVNVTYRGGKRPYQSNVFLLRVCVCCLATALGPLKEQQGAGGCSGAHLNMEAQPAPDQMEWTTTGYTQAAMKKEYSAYASTRARSAMAPETMVQAVAANCAWQGTFKLYVAMTHQPTASEACAPACLYRMACTSRDLA